MVKKDDFVLVHYTGTFDDGEVFDTSMDGDPLEFQVGGGMIIPGFDSAVIGMKINDEKKIRIASADAYGGYDETLVQPFPLEEVKESFEPEVGMTIALHGEDGHHLPAIIMGITATEVMVDMNHPLAGKDLNFILKLVDINDEAKYPSRDCSSGCSDHGCSGGSCC